MKHLFIGFILLLSSANASAHSESFETYGDVGQFAIPLTALFIAWAKDDPQGMYQLGKGWAYTQAVTHGLKLTVHARRPNGVDCNSFPSGHTSSAFSGAAFLHHRYGWQYGLPAYIAATGVGASRIEASKHWQLDVLAGAAIAYGVSYFVTERCTITNLQLAPARFGKDGQGLMFSYRF